MKAKWKKQLDAWKEKNRGVLQKNNFPRLLNKVIKELGNDANKNLKAGFASCGIVPFDPQQVLKRIPVKNIGNNYSWLQSFEKHLENRRSNETSVRTKKKKTDNRAR